MDATDGAAVRIAMTAAATGVHDGLLRRVVEEAATGNGEFDVRFEDRYGNIQADLTIGANVVSAVASRANEDISNPGVKLHGAGFIVMPEQAALLGLGTLPGLEKHLRQYRNGRDLTATPRGVMVIDLFGLRSEEVRERFPAVYQWVHDRVKPERDANNRASYRDKWWIFGEARASFRPALASLHRYIATVETSKHRFFTFLDASILPDDMLVNIALDDAYYLGVLSSRVHVMWALANGGTLQDRPRYNKTRCFEPFPFPQPSDAQRRQIRQLGEDLDAHRKDRQREHPALTMTSMYNVLEKLRAGDTLSYGERAVHEQGLVGVLREIHDKLDVAVMEAYGWPGSTTDEELLQRLVALNGERAAEEAQGIVRWLRPEYQDPASMARASTLGITAPTRPIKDALRPWPAALPRQAQSVRSAVVMLNRPVTAAELACYFDGARTKRVAELLDTLAGLGQISITDGRKYLA